LKIEIFNVERGFCAALEADECHTTLLDCGYSFRTGFRPARYLLNRRSRQIDYLVISAYTKGHLTSFADLNSYFAEHDFSVGCLIANPSIDATSIPELAVRNPSTGRALQLLNKVDYRQRKIDRPIQWENCELSFFWNSYPDCLDIRHLSLVTFLSCQGTHAIFPSDLKTAGWRSLLKQPEFCDRLRKVNLFIASNYGRENGYCPEVFNYCTPDLVIISNNVRRSLSDSMLSQYERHARGFQTSLGRQKVLTTRDAGTITIHPNRTGAPQVMTQKREVYQYQTS